MRVWHTEGRFVDHSHIPVSMLDGRLFEKLEVLGRITRQNGRPFGGLQIILSGDFLQLGPVRDLYPSSSPKPLLAFEAGTWPDCVTHMIGLRVVYRQQNIGKHSIAILMAQPELVSLLAFLSALQDLRIGVISQSSRAMFEALRRRKYYPDGIEPTVL